MNIPRELISAIAQGDAILLIGRELSIEAGLPSWNDLLAPLANNINLPFSLRVDPLRIAQYYQNQRDRRALISHILEQMDSTGKVPTNNHHRLVRLGTQTWVTTNHDTLLEQTFRECGERFTKVVSDQDLPYMSSGTTTLVKLHGDYEQPATIVITQQDYETYFRRFPRVKQKLSSLLVDKTFFFIGYNIDDPDFNQLQAQIAFDLQYHQRPAYATLFDVDAFTFSDLRSRNIHVINIPTNNQAIRADQLGKLLDDLLQEVSEARRNKAPSLFSASATPLRSRAYDVHGLLEAMGYRITQVQGVGNDLYFTCYIKSGAKIHQEVVSFVDKQPVVNDLTRLNDSIVSNNAESGILLTPERFPIQLRDFAYQLKRINCYTLDEFTDQLADFQPYLQRITENHETSSIPQFYVPLSAQNELAVERAPEIFKPVESFVDTWLTEPNRSHLSILGDFGSGKTWFCQHYAYLATKRYLADPTHNRIPILITLRDYSRAYNLEQLITDAIVNRFRVGLAAGYKTFARLNEAGRLLLIFDGFDEMERRVSDYRTATDNFWELAKVVSPASKVLLTCRTAYFRHGEEERETLIPGRNRTTRILGKQDIDLHDPKKFELIHLLNFTDEDIRLALQKRLPTDWEKVYEKIQALSNLRDLASRPVLLDMIVKALPEIDETHQINQVTLYETYVNSLLQQRWSEDSDYIPPKVRLSLVQELAWEMYQRQKLAIPLISFSEFPEWIARHFDLKDSPEERIAFLARDMRAQSYLLRDDDGNYQFSHKSFLEYFVACKMASVISASNYDTKKALAIWKTKPLTPETCEFLMYMLADSISLWRLIRATQKISIADAGYAGGNAATLLQLQGKSFVGEKLSRTNLTGADLHNGNLKKADLRGACLRQANIRNCILEQTDMREVDLTQAHIEEMGSVEAVMFDPSGEFVISGSSDGIVRSWRWIDGAQVGQFLADTDVTSISVAGKLILAGVGQNGHIKMWDRESSKLIGTFIGHTGLVWKMSFCPSNHCFASGAHDGSIRIWDLQSCKQLSVIYGQDRGIWDICYSPDGNYIAAAGGPKLGIYEALTGKAVWTSPEQTIEFRNVKYDSNNLLAYTTREGSIILRDAKSKQLIRSMKGSIVGPNSIAFSPDGQMLAVGGSGPDVKVQIWDMQTGTMIMEENTNSKGYIGMIHWGANKCLVSGSSDGIIRIWDANPNSSTFKSCLKTLEARMNCRKALIDGAKGLDVPAPDGEGNLRNWFIARGAVEWPPSSFHT